MNSLSMFEWAENPLASFLESVSGNHFLADGVEVASNGLEQLITLPNNRCQIKILNNQITVTRTDTRFSYERSSMYQIDSIDAAKSTTGILSGLCHECGCKSFKDADATVKLIYYIILLNINPRGSA